MGRFWIVVVTLAACGDNGSAPKDAAGDAANDAAVDAATCETLGCEDNETCTNDVCDPVDGCRHVSLDRCAEPLCAMTSCAGTDTDGDGLQDAWELQGYVDVNCNGVNDGDGVDVQLADANVAVPDAYIEIDYHEMAGTGAACTNDAAGDAACNSAVLGESCVNGVCTHTHRPRQASLDLARLAAARGLSPLPNDPSPPADLAGKPGFRIHWEHADAIPETSGLVVSFGNYEASRDLDPACVGPNGQNFFDLKDAHFFGATNPALFAARRRIVHYAIATHVSQCPIGAVLPNDFCQACPADRGGGTPQAGSSGSAEIPGNDFMISLGDRFFTLGRLTTVIPREEAGTILHELGHNLGLLHGVLLVNGVHTPSFAPEYNPIYFSVMNYNYQFGMLFAATPGSKVPVSFRLDYADDTVCAELSEASLIESDGAQCGPTSTRVIRFVPNTGTPVFGSATTGTGIDWDNDGTISTTAGPRDLNGIVANETFYTINEWGYAAGKFTNLAFDSFCSPWAMADALPSQEARVFEPSSRLTQRR
ncbi:MAG TPA: hypothetical protein VFV99_17620 [Kofleriaceae bacterium]|nr:hypothetical protein [Kofleriaceae bacterium]